MTVLHDIGRWLRRERQHQALTQQELAHRAGISRAYLSEIERGKRDLSVTVLVKLQQALGPTSGRDDRDEGSSS